MGVGLLKLVSPIDIIRLSTAPWFMKMPGCTAVIGRPPDVVGKSRRTGAYRLVKPDAGRGRGERPPVANTTRGRSHLNHLTPWNWFSWRLEAGALMPISVVDQARNPRSSARSSEGQARCRLPVQAAYSHSAQCHGFWMGCRHDAGPTMDDAMVNAKHGDKNPGYGTLLPVVRSLTRRLTRPADELLA